MEVVTRELATCSLAETQRQLEEGKDLLLKKKKKKEWVDSSRYVQIGVRVTGKLEAE